MTFKPNSAVIIGTLTLAVLYGIMKYAAPDQLANLKEKVSNPFNSELALGDKLSKLTRSISNPFQSELTLEEIMPANEDYKADTNNTPKNEIAGFYIGQYEASAPCKPDFVNLYEMDGTPRAKSIQCYVSGDKSKTLVVFHKNHVVKITSMVFIKKTNIDNILILLKSKFGDKDLSNKEIPDKYAPDEYGLTSTSFSTEGFYPVSVYTIDCIADNEACSGSAKSLNLHQESDDKFMVAFTVEESPQVSKAAEIPLTTSEYNLEAKKLGLAPIRNYAVVKNSSFANQLFSSQVLELCLEYVDTLDRTEITKHSTEKKFQVKSVKMNTFWNRNIHPQFGDNYVLQMVVDYDVTRTFGEGYSDTIDYYCVVSPEMKFLGVEFPEDASAYQSPAW